ncbi:MAG: DUF2062 domain-containing protein [Ignavibacteria bacterium]|nr:DUF2062 domain-containing protein [Ignavibacteria bacterium]
MKRFFRNKYIAPISRLLMQGITPKEIALTVAGSCALAIFPVIGATTLLSSLFALRFKLNVPLVQLINYTLAPLQIILLVPYMKIGMFFFGAGGVTYSTEQILRLITTDPFGAISVLWTATMCAVGIWLITAPAIALVLYKITLRIILKLLPARA